jgi:hypothetical protein
MSLDTYANLQVEVADWLNRADLTAKIPTFITLLEAQMNRKLRVRQMMTRATATLTAEYITIPTDFRAVHNVQILDEPSTRVEYASISEVSEFRRSYPNQRPMRFNVDGSTFQFAPIPDSSYTVEIVYYAAIPPLATSGSGTNWLLTEHPDIYLYGTLMQAAPYLNNDDRIQIWGGALQGILEDMTVADEKATRGGGPLRARIQPYASRGV